MIDRLMRKTHHVMKNVPVLRRLDTWAVGIWFRLPFLRWIYQAALLFKLTALAIRKKRRLVVFCRFGGIGDMICSFPAVREFIRQNPSREMVYVTRTAFGEVLRRSGLPIPCVTIGRHVLPPRWATSVVGKCIELSYANEAANPPRPPTHLIDDFARNLGFGPVAGGPSLSVDAVQVEKIRTRYLQGEKKWLVLLHAGPTWPVKEWPLDAWGRLVARLRENPGIEVLQIVAARNVTVRDVRCPIIPGTVSVKCADDVGRLIDTIAAADLLIAVDSGPVHVAAAVGTRCVALFGPTDPDLLLWKRDLSEAVVHKLDCSFCHHRRPRLHWQTGCPYDIACMQGITVEQVLQKALDFLPRGVRERRSS